MFNKKQHETDHLQEAIDEALSELKTVTADSDEYNAILDKIERLHRLKETERKSERRVSPDALVAAGASVLGIVLILGFEHAGVVTSKALGFVMKTKI